MDLNAIHNFHGTPFTREFRVKERFMIPVHEEAVDALERTVSQRMSAALIAPAGMGKTVVLRALADRLSAARYRVNYVKVTHLSMRDMCREISWTLGINAAGSYPALVRRIQERFTNAFDADGLRPVLILDEAQDIRLSVLSIVKILTNFDMDSRLVVSIILSGQPGLRDYLGRQEMEDVARRLAHIATLRPLSRKEAQQYMQHRCTVAGATQFPFDSGAVDGIFEITSGNPRAIDRVALKSLELASAADERTVNANHVVAARKALWA